jgi:hypothetical protein
MISFMYIVCLHFILEEFSSINLHRMIISINYFYSVYIFCNYIDVHIMYIL